MLVAMCACCAVTGATGNFEMSEESNRGNFK